MIKFLYHIQQERKLNLKGIQHAVALDDLNGKDGTPIFYRDTNTPQDESKIFFCGFFNLPQQERGRRRGSWKIKFTIQKSKHV